MKKAIIITLLILVIFVAIPYGTYEASCGKRLRELGSLADKTYTALASASYPGDSYEATVNGDCSTANTVYFSYTTSHKFQNGIEAKKDFVAKMRAHDINLLGDSMEPKYTSAKDGNISGGSTPIRTIELTYSDNQFSTYMYDFTYANPVACEVLRSGKTSVICGGIEQKEKIQEMLLTTSPATFRVWGYIAHD